MGWREKKHANHFICDINFIIYQNLHIKANIYRNEQCSLASSELYIQIEKVAMLTKIHDSQVNAIKCETFLSLNTERNFSMPNKSWWQKWVTHTHTREEMPSDFSCCMWQKKRERIFAIMVLFFSLYRNQIHYVSMDLFIFSTRT